jgi:hypothetical protein
MVKFACRDRAALVLLAICVVVVGAGFNDHLYDVGLSGTVLTKCQQMRFFAEDVIVCGSPIHHHVNCTGFNSIDIILREIEIAHSGGGVFIKNKSLESELAGRIWHQSLDLEFGYWPSFIANFRRFIVWECRNNYLAIDSLSGGFPAIRDIAWNFQWLIREELELHWFHGNPSTFINNKIVVAVAPLAPSYARIDNYSNDASAFKKTKPPWGRLISAMVGAIGIMWGWYNLRGFRPSIICFYIFLGGCVLLIYGLIIVLPWSISVH